MTGRFLSFSFGSLVFLVLAGCASNPSVTSLSSEERARLALIKVYNPLEIAGKKIEMLGSVKGLSCRRDRYSNKATTDDEAIDGLRIHAAKMGGHGVTSVACERSPGVDWGNNCWDSVVCVGDVFIFVGESPKEPKAAGAL